MSSSLQQIVEVRLDGKWTYVPLASEVNDQNCSIYIQGSVRDLFAFKWNGAEKYMNFGVPEDISKEAREAMIFEDEDYIESGACWITWQQYEALSESLRQKMLSDIDRIVESKSKNSLSERLSRIESILGQMNGTHQDKEEKEIEDTYCNEEYAREDLEDHMWAWVSAERNMGEIEAYVDRFLEQDHWREDFPGMELGVRVIMYVSY